MSPQAVRVRTSSGWQDIAIQGAPGIPGATPSAKAHSTAAFSWSAADANWRVYTPPLTIDFDTIGGNCFAANAGRFTAPATGKYLIGITVESLSVVGNVGIGVIVNGATVPSGGQISAVVPSAAAGNKGGHTIWRTLALNAGDTVGIFGWNSGGGTAILTIEAIRLDALGPGAFDGTWQSWSPVIKQGGAALGYTNNRSRYCVLGKLVHFQTYMVLTVAGLINNGINVTVPVPMATANPMVVGSFWISATQVSPPNIAGIAVAVDAASVQFVSGGQISNYVGATPSFALASGNSVWVSGTYEAA